MGLEMGGDSGGMICGKAAHEEMGYIPKRDSDNLEYGYWFVERTAKKPIMRQNVQRYYFPTNLPTDVSITDSLIKIDETNHSPLTALGKNTFKPTSRYQKFSELPKDVQRDLVDEYKKFLNTVKRS